MSIKIIISCHIICNLYEGGLIWSVCKIIIINNIIYHILFILKAPSVRHRYGLILSARLFASSVKAFNINECKVYICGIEFLLHCVKFTGLEGNGTIFVIVS